MIKALKLSITSYIILLSSLDCFCVFVDLFYLHRFYSAIMYVFCDLSRDQTDLLLSAKLIIRFCCCKPDHDLFSATECYDSPQKYVTCLERRDLIKINKGPFTRQKGNCVSFNLMSACDR